MNIPPSSTVYFYFVYWEENVPPQDWLTVLFKNGALVQQSITITATDAPFIYGGTFTTDATNNAAWHLIVRRVNETFWAYQAAWFAQTPLAPAEIAERVLTALVADYSATPGSVAHYLAEAKQFVANDLVRIQGTDNFNLLDDEGQSSLITLTITDNERTRQP